MIRLLIMIGIGFFTWLLTFSRSIAFRKQQTGLLSGIIFLDEISAISIGMFLARYGSWTDAVCCALGGTCAAILMIKVTKCQQQQMQD